MADTPKGWRLKRPPSAEDMADQPTPNLLDNLDVHLEHVANAVEKLGRGSPEKQASDKQQIASIVRTMGRLWRERRGGR